MGHLVSEKVIRRLMKEEGIKVITLLESYGFKKLRYNLTDPEEYF